MVLGLDIGMDIVVELVSQGLVRRFMFHNHVKKKVVSWFEQSLNNFLGYTPTITFLMKGWLCLTCRSREDATTMLNKA